MNPDVLANSEEALFRGVVKSQSERFGKIVQRVCRKYEAIIKRDFGFDIKDNLSLEQIAHAVEKGPRMAAMARDLAALRNSMNHSSAVGAVTNASGGERIATQQPLARLHVQYKHSDGKYRRVPPSWVFPKVGLQVMYQYWHCGDESNRIPPIKFFANSDVDFLGKTSRIRLSELRKVMSAIDDEAALKGYAPQEHMDQKSTNTCYHHGESKIVETIPQATPGGRKRLIEKMKWSTVVKYMHKKRVQSE